MLLIRTHQRATSIGSGEGILNDSEPLTDDAVPSVVQTVRTWHAEGRSQRSIARDLNIDRRKIKQIIDGDAA